MLSKEIQVRILLFWYRIIPCGPNQSSPTRCESVLVGGFLIVASSDTMALLSKSDCQESVQWKYIQTVKDVQNGKHVF